LSTPQPAPIMEPMSDRSTFFGEQETPDTEPVASLPTERACALDPGVAAVFDAIAGLSLADQLAALESSLDAVRAALEVGLILPPETFLALKMDTEFN
jgi:hypothetical protein